MSARAETAADSSPSLGEVVAGESAPSLAAAIQNVADAYYEVEHATSRIEFFAKVLVWWDAREALREYLTGAS